MQYPYYIVQQIDGNKDFLNVSKWLSLHLNKYAHILCLDIHQFQAFPGPVSLTFMLNSITTINITDSTRWSTKIRILLQTITIPVPRKLYKKPTSIQKRPMQPEISLQTCVYVNSTQRNVTNLSRDAIFITHSSGSKSPSANTWPETPAIISY